MRKNLTDVITIFQAVPVKPQASPPDLQSITTSDPPTPSETPRVGLEPPRVPSEAPRVPLEPEVRRNRGLRDNRVNFKKSDTESSDVTNDVIKSLNKDIKRRQQQQRTKSSLNTEVKSARSHHATAGKLARSFHAAEGKLARPQHATEGKLSACDCVPILEKIGKRLETDKKQIMHQINDRSVKQLRAANPFFTETALSLFVSVFYFLSSITALG